MDIAAINNQIKEFLIYGIDENDTDDITDEINKYVEQFKNLYEKENAKSREFMKTVSELKEKANEKQMLYHDPVIIEKFIQYTKLNVKIQHLNLFHAIQQLDRYQNVEDIPDIVLGSFVNIPSTVFTRSKVYKLLIQTTRKIRASILQTFHKQFEEHLVGNSNESDSEEDNTANHNRNFSQSLQNDGVDLWSKFLTTSKVWLLAYSLLSVLPVVLTGESHHRVSEVYQDALDEAFTPIWGRFHYHLEVARQARTKSHVVWTFNYAKSFVQMLADLCSQLTVCGKLEHLCPIEYNKAGKKHVSDKAIRFLRAHLAQMIEDFSPLSASMCIQIVEESFELQQVLETIDPSACALAAGGGSICSVFYDSKDLFHQWLHLEISYFSCSIKELCDSSELAYGFDFNHSVILSDDNDPRRQFKCYRSVYTSISLVVAACQRYRLLPKPAQLILSECVIEPLLCSIIGLFLLRIRSHPVLYSISCGDFRPDSEVEGYRPDVLHDFKWCVQYAQDCLSCAEAHGAKVAASSQRLRVRWAEIQSWVPKSLIADPGAKLSELIRLCFKLSPRYSSRDASSQYSYRNTLESMNALDSSSNNSSGLLKYGYTSANQATSVVDTMVDCLDLCEGMIGTLENVMERQYSNANK